MKLETGICGEQSVRVSAENTAKTMGSGTLDVFATPALVALAEKTCWHRGHPAGAGAQRPHPCGHDRDLPQRAGGSGRPQADL